MGSSVQSFEEDESVITHFHEKKFLTKQEKISIVTS